MGGQQHVPAASSPREEPLSILRNILLLLLTQPQAVCLPCRDGRVQSQLLQHTVRQAGEDVRATGRRVAAYTAATVHRRHHLLLQIHHRPVRISTHSIAHLLLNFPASRAYANCYSFILLAPELFFF